jgi:D-xylulose reductase
MGHEASGTVHAIGPNVKKLRLGDAVAIEPGFGCRTCSKCKEGKYNLCPEMKFAACPPHQHGTLSKFFKVPADCCYKISGSIDSEFASEFPSELGSSGEIGLDEAVLIEPMSVAVHSVKQVGVKPGDRVIVFGAGTVGLLCAAVAREFGANLIVSVDLSDAKLEFAKKFVGEDRMRFRTVIPDRALNSEENAVALRSWLGCVDPDADLPGFDVAIEATGAESCIQTAIHSLKVGGSFVQTGLGNRHVNFPISTVSENEITIKGCFRYGAGDFQMALELAKSKKVDLKSLITKVVPFENVVEAWETTRRGEGIKTLIRGVERAI